MNNSESKIRWEQKLFEELSAPELYKILQLRAEVFVVEQNCPYQDLDDKDLKARHLMGYAQDGKLIAYARLLPAKVSYDEVSIGRVVSSPGIRGQGAGRMLLKEALERIRLLFGPVPIKIGAQLYLQKFYEEFLFEVQGEVYPEDGIPHVHMLRSADKYLTEM